MHELSAELHHNLVEIVRSRFFERIELYELYLWLDNFEPEEYEFAIEILNHIDYYREADFESMLESCLRQLLAENPQTVFHFVPVGSAGKSGDFVLYLVQKICKSRRIRHSLHHTIAGLDIPTYNENDRVVYVDDFVGTGSTFADFVPEDEHFIDVINRGNTVFLCGIIMRHALDYLNKRFPQITIKYGDVKTRAFQDEPSPFGGYVKSKRIREFAYKYGSELYKDYPLGFKNTQSLVIIEHSSPNNSLPIIWSDTMYNGKQWYPLAPRSYAIKISRACQSRLDNNRWLYLMRRALDVEETYDLSTIFTEKNYTLILVLRMLMDNRPESVIVNSLGLTYDDFQKLKNLGIDKNIWDNNLKVSPYAEQQYKDALSYLIIKGREERRKIEMLSDERNDLYIPETFKGLK